MSISKKTLQIVHERLGGVCEVEGCDSMDLESVPHHIKYRSRGGSDNAINLMDICKDHHRRVHRGKESWTKKYKTHFYHEEGINELGEKIWK